MPRHTGSGK